jgi:LmbE family N-acetylglucosaminyl deacetylase
MSESLLSNVSPGRPVSWREAPLPDRTRVMMVAPHPDDFDAMGVTMRFLHQRGHLLRALVCQTASGVEDSFCSPPTRDTKQRLREQEQRDSLRFFGLAEDDFDFLDLDRDPADDDQPFDHPANQARLAELLLPFRPQLVFLPHGHDTNSGHRVMFALVSRLLRGAGFPVTVCLARDPKTLGMRMDIHTPFGEEEAQWKAELLRFHRSQHQRNLNTRGHGLDERLLAVNRSVACDLKLPLPYAEAFELAFF